MNGLYYDLPRQDATIHQRFELYNNARSALLTRAQEMCSYVLPRLLQSDATDGINPPGLQEHEALGELYWHKPGQAAEGLKAKIVQAVFPPNGVPFFQFELEQNVINALAEGGVIPPEMVEDLPLQKAELENYLLSVLQASNYRDTLDSGVGQIICLPNTLVFQSDDHKFRTYRVDQFVMRKQIDGSLAEIITRDWVEADLLPEELKGVRAERNGYMVGRYEPYYTQIVWDSNKDRWQVNREFREEKVAGGGTYEKDLLPYYPLHYASSVGETYGTSLVEVTFPLIRSGEEVARALVEGLAAGSEGRWAVDPTGITNISDLQDTGNWSFVAAREQDIFTLQANVGQSVAAAQAALQMYGEDIDKAFMTNAASMLTGERVTAYQVNRVENQLDEGLGSPLNAIASQIQRPTILRTLHIETKAKRISPFWMDLLKAGGMKLQVKTGLDALGRQLDAARITALMSTVYQTQDPELIAVFKKTEMAHDLTAASGLTPTRYVKTMSELAAEREAAMQQAMQAQAAEQAISTAGKVVEQGARTQ